jgi:hypothetical protein
MTARTPSVRVLLACCLVPPLIAAVAVVTIVLLGGSSGPTTATGQATGGKPDWQAENQSPKSSEFAKPGRHDMPLQTYRAVAPRDPKKFMLFCMIDHFYGFDFSGAENTFYSVSMEEPKTRVRIMDTR